MENYRKDGAIGDFHAPLSQRDHGPVEISDDGAGLEDSMHEGVVFHAGRHLPQRHRIVVLNQLDNQSTDNVGNLVELFGQYTSG